ncbi:MAG: hydroxysqualene dehydroxylase HpnE [Kiloniellales bacterium]|jgi:squalene-associated FAD-dependent desaturase
MTATPPAPTVHVVGAGIAGLSCAVRLARSGTRVNLYEAAGQAGGRCRSFYESRLGRTIDNGNHILLAANHEALSYVEEIGARDGLIGPPRAAFPFVDLQTGERWTLEPGRGRIPWWLLDPRRRIPGTGVASYLAGLRLARAGPDATVADCLDRRDPLWARFWEPLTVAALNTAPEEASARLLWLVLKESFLRGEAACRPLIARDGLAACFVEPALARLRETGAVIAFNRRLRGLGLGDDRVRTLDFGDMEVPVSGGERVVLALPPAVTGSLLPDAEVPGDSRPIVNVHILLPSPPKLPGNLPFLGLVGGAADWLFVRGDVASLTVSAASDLAEQPLEVIGRRLWGDTAKALALEPDPMPPLRVIKERRATFAQTPAALARRLPARTSWPNLLLAGDWTDTGYPATIESAVRSGRTAARLVVGE